MYLNEFDLSWHFVLIFSNLQICHVLSRKCHDLYPENAQSVVMGKARHRIGFDIETTGIWLIVSDKFPSWEMLGNFIEISGTR